MNWEELLKTEDLQMLETDSLDWGLCSIGQLLEFPVRESIKIEKAVRAKSMELYNLGVDFAGAIAEGDIDGALAVHRKIHSGEFAKVAMDIKSAL